MTCPISRDVHPYFRANVLFTVAELIKITVVTVFIMETLKKITYLSLLPFAKMSVKTYIYLLLWNCDNPPSLMPTMPVLTFKPYK